MTQGRSWPFSVPPFPHLGSGVDTSLSSDQTASTRGPSEQLLFEARIPAGVLPAGTSTLLQVWSRGSQVPSKPHLLLSSPVPWSAGSRRGQPRGCAPLTLLKFHTFFLLPFCFSRSCPERSLCNMSRALFPANSLYAARYPRWQVLEPSITSQGPGESNNWPQVPQGSKN